jgi:BirA family transcriptional regulator, biotin operon repressor / biotin---[acetyl-CoA-carboxylase] ligase
LSTDEQILTALHAAGEAGASGAELSQRLGVTRAAIWARIEDLRRLGYNIEASPHLGYRLLSAPDLLHAEDLLARLGKGHVIGRDVRVFQQTTSTSDIIHKLAEDGVTEGVVVFAETQTKGRGRLGRTWASPPGKGLWFSVLLRPALRPQQATQLTVAAATALVRAIEAQTGIKADIKWPNDLHVDGRKLAGILTEMSAELERVHSLILGIGVNANLSATDFPPAVRSTATSLRLLAGAAVDRPALATRILQELDRDYARVRHGEFRALAEEWESCCTTIGQTVALDCGGRRLRGCAEALDEEGALLLRTEHGRLERIIGGDVTVEKPPVATPALSQT